MGEKGWWLCGCLPNKKKEKEKKDKKKKDKKDKDGKSSSSKSKGKNKEDDLGTNAFSNMVNQTINCKVRFLNVSLFSIDVRRFSNKICKFTTIFIIKNVQKLFQNSFF